MSLSSLISNYCKDGNFEFFQGKYRNIYRFTKCSFPILYFGAVIYHLPYVILMPYGTVKYSTGTGFFELYTSLDTPKSPPSQALPALHQKRKASIKDTTSPPSPPATYHSQPPPTKRQGNVHKNRLLQNLSIPRQAHRFQPSCPHPRPTPPPPPSGNPKRRNRARHRLQQRRRSRTPTPPPCSKVRSRGRCGRRANPKITIACQFYALPATPRQDRRSRGEGGMVPGQLCEEIRIQDSSRGGLREG